MSYGVVRLSASLCHFRQCPCVMGSALERPLLSLHGITIRIWPIYLEHFVAFQRALIESWLIGKCVSIGSTTSTQRLCDLSSAGKFGRGKAEAKLSLGG